MRQSRHINCGKLFAGVAFVGTATVSALFAIHMQAADGDEAQTTAAPEAATQAQFFENDVLPILKAHCFECHGPVEKVKGGLSLISRENVLKGGETGPAVNLENPAESELLSAINFELLEMPPKGKLPKEQIEVLTRWVKMGAPWSPGVKIKPHATKEPDGHGPPQVNAKTKSHWAFQPVKRPDVSPVEKTDRVRTPVDAFILKGLEAAGLSQSQPADRTSLLRRAYYDLTGLPPSPVEVKEFLADDSSHAFETVVNRLLDSPHYGEKWGRHWLDLVRYAETNSYERDGAKPHVWRYRDYVINAFNTDKPYDEFLTQQLAGDEMDPVTPDGIVATGYYRLGRWDDEPADPLLALYDDLDDVVKTTSQVMLGLTMDCARCHDHKLDPIPQRDYYRMLAFFRNVNRYGVRSHETVLEASVRSIAPEAETKQHEEVVTAHRRRMESVRREIRELENLARPKLTNVEKDEFKSEANRIPVLKKRVPEVLSQKQFDKYVALIEQRSKLRKFRAPELARALCVTEGGPHAPQMFVLVRGNPAVKGDPVEPGFPQVLSPPEPQIDEPEKGAKSSNRRLALAHWIAGPENPLTARVMMNRVWQHHFGRGIVRSTNNFGLQGYQPTHPELLDWLAAEFTNPTLDRFPGEPWSLKRIHRMIMLSNAYRTSSRPTPHSLAADQANDHFHHFNMRRLTAEEIRDSILAVNGNLNLKQIGGPSIYTVIPEAVLAGQSRPGDGWDDSPPEQRNRRSVYIHVKRSLLTPILEGFDFADTDATCPVRFSTTQPTQALGMLNSEFIIREAREFADDLKEKAGNDRRKQVKTALERVMQRAPNDQEITRGVELIATLEKELNADPDSALRQFCVVALNLNEFMYLD